MRLRYGHGRCARLTIVCLLCIAGAVGCGGQRGPSLLTASEVRHGGGSLSTQRRELADRLFERLQAEQAAGRDRSALALAYELIDHYPEHRDQDRALLLGARSARRLGDVVTARRLVRECLERHPESRWRGEALALYADLETGAAETAAGSWAASPAIAPSATLAVDPTRIGVLLPLSGRHADTGRAIDRGVRLAVSDVNRAGWRQFRLSTHDTGGDPVTAALAARRLIVDEGVIGLLVAAPSDAEIGAVVAAADHGVPLLLLMRDDERLLQLGTSLFQGGQPLAAELRLLVRAARRLAARERFALVHPDTPLGRRARELLTAALNGEGGKLVATVATGAAVDPGAAARPVATSAPWRQLAEARPDAVVLLVPAGELGDHFPECAPGGGILPAGALLLGTGAWNTPLLIERGGVHVEGVLLPANGIVYPAAWTERCAQQQQQEAKGKHDAFGDGSSRVLAGYLAARRLLTTIAEHDLSSRADLSAALAREEREARWLPEAPQELARLLLTVRSGRIVPYRSLD